MTSHGQQPHHPALLPQYGQSSAPPQSRRSQPQHGDPRDDHPPPSQVRPAQRYGIEAAGQDGVRMQQTSAGSGQQYYYPTPPNGSAVKQRTPASNLAPSSLGGSSQSSPNNFNPPGPVAHGYGSPSHADQADAAVGDNGSAGENGTDDPKRPRACEACRGLKVKCDQDPANPEIPCKRCAKAGRQCIVTQPSRKRQKKADNRVAELEKKLDALTAALHQQGGASRQSPPPWANMNSFGHTDEGPNAKRRRLAEVLDETPSYDGADVSIQARPVRYVPADKGKSEDPDGPVPDEMHSSWSRKMDLKRCLHRTSPEEFVRRINNLVAPEMAKNIFKRYCDELAPHLPAVVFPSGTTAEQVFDEKPILYVSVLAAAAYGVLPADIWKALQTEATGAIADCVVRSGAKNLELIQAMQIMAMWYKPPERTEQTNFYQIIHMAAVMALDIGLGKRFNPSKAARKCAGPVMGLSANRKTLAQDSDTLEARRAWVGCYYLCAGASMVLRRPNLIRWTNYIKECLEVLETSPDAAPTDKLLCQHVKIQHICEDVGLQFLMDDTTAQISITDPKVTYALTVLENQLRDWRKNIPPEFAQSRELRFFEHVSSLYLHEIALHFNHNIEDFRLPFTEESLKSVAQTSDTLTQGQMAALEACLSSAHGILDTMLGFNIQALMSLPMLLYFVRCVYSIVILIKLHVAVSSPNSELGKLMRPEDLKVDYYIDSLLKMFSYVAQERRGTTPDHERPKVLRILSLLKDWFAKHKEGTAAARSSPERRGNRSETASGNDGPELPAKRAADGREQDNHSGQHEGTDVDGARDWTFTHLGPIAFPQKRRDEQPGAKYSVNASMAPNGTKDESTPGNPQQSISGALSYSVPADAALPWTSYGGSMVDSMNAAGDFGWGSGFEQAMDIALGGVDGLTDGSFDGWLLGDGAGHYVFDGQTHIVGASGSWA